MAIQHGNLGIVKNNLQLYYNREFSKSFRGEATTNIAYSSFSTLNSNSNWWTNSGTAVFSDNDTTIAKPTILNVNNSNFVVFSYQTTAAGNQQLGSAIIPISPSTQYTFSIYGYFTTTAMDAPPYLRTNVNNNSLGSFAYNGDTTYANWPKNQWIRLSCTATTQANENGIYMSSYIGSYVGQKIYYCGYQVEQKAYATPLVLGSRNANTAAGGGGLLDLSPNGYSSDLNSSAVAFNNGGFYFNADAAGAITIPVANSVLDTLSNNTHTYELWFKLLGTPPGTSDGYFFGRQGYHEGFAHFKATPTTFGVLSWYNDNNNTGWLSYAGSLNVWYHAAYVVNVETATRQLYVNGVLYSSGNLTGQLKQYVSGPSYYYYLGSANPSYSSNIIVSNAKAYNRALTASEISRNFNAQRSIYGI